MRTKEEKRYRLTILVLILINIAVIGAWWAMTLNEPPRGRSGWSNERGEFRRDYFEKALNLDETQKKQFANLTREHMRSIREMNLEIEKLKNDYRGFLMINQLDSATADSLFQTIAQKRAAIDTSMIHHFHRLRAVCTPDQSEQFDSLMTNFMLRRERREGSRKGPRPRAEIDEKK